MWLHRHHGHSHHQNPKTIPKPSENHDEEIYLMTAAFWHSALFLAACGALWFTWANLAPLVAAMLAAALASAVLHPVKTAVAETTRVVVFGTGYCYNSGSSHHQTLAKSKTNLVKKVSQGGILAVERLCGAARSFYMALSIASLVHLTQSKSFRKNARKTWRNYIEPLRTEEKILLGAFISTAAFILAYLYQTNKATEKASTKRRKTSADKKRTKRSNESKEELILKPKNILQRFQECLQSFLKKLDKKINSYVEMTIEKLAEVLGLKEVPKQLLMLIREKSPSRKVDVLSVPRTFTHSKYKRHRRDSERRCSLPTISEDVASKSANRNSLQTKKFLHSSEDLRIKALIKNLANKSPELREPFQRAGSPHPCSDAARSRIIARFPDTDRSFSFDEDEGYADECAMSELNNVQPVQEVERVYVSPPAQTHKFGNFLTPPDLFQMPFGSEMHFGAEDFLNAGLAFRPRSSSDVGVQTRSDSISSVDSETDEWTSSSITLDEEDGLEDLDYCEDSEKNWHGLISVLWFRLLQYANLRHKMLASLPAVWIIPFIFKTASGSGKLDAMEEHFDLLHYHWCIKWRERKHLLAPHPLPKMMSLLKLGYRRIFQLCHDCIDTCAAIFTMCLALGAGAIFLIWFMTELEKDAVAIAKLWNESWANYTTNATYITEEPIDNESLVEPQVILNILDDHFHLVDGSSELLQSAVATAVSTGKVYLSQTLLDEDEIEWIKMNNEGEIEHHHFYGHLWAVVAQISFELWISMTIVYQLLKREDNLIWDCCTWCISWLDQIGWLLIGSRNHHHKCKSYIGTHLAVIFNSKRLVNSVFLAMWTWTILEVAGMQILLLPAVVTGVLSFLSVLDPMLATLPLVFVETWMLDENVRMKQLVLVLGGLFAGEHYRLLLNQLEAVSCQNAKFKSLQSFIKGLVGCSAGALASLAVCFCAVSSMLK